MNTSTSSSSVHTSDINLAAALITLGVPTTEPCAMILADRDGVPRVEFFFRPSARDGTSTESLVQAWDGKGPAIQCEDLLAWIKAFAANKRKLVQFIKTGRPLTLVEREGRNALVEYGSPLHRKLASKTIAELKPIPSNALD